MQTFKHIYKELWSEKVNLQDYIVVSLDFWFVIEVVIFNSFVAEKETAKPPTCNIYASEFKL